MRHLQPCLHHLRVPYSHPMRLTTTAELPCADLGGGAGTGRCVGVFGGLPRGVPWRPLRRCWRSRQPPILPATQASTMEHGVVGGSDSVSVPQLGPQAASGPGASNSSSCACGGASASGVAHQRGAVATPGLLGHRTQLAGMQPFKDSSHLSLQIEIPVVTPVCRACSCLAQRMYYRRRRARATVPAGERARSTYLALRYVNRAGVQSVSCSPTHAPTVNQF